MAHARTFGIWFLIGAGLLLSGCLSVEAIREYRAEHSSDNFLFLLGLFVIAGGVFTGLLALSIRRLAEPTAGTGVLLRGEALMERATLLGVSLQHTHDSNGNLLEPELQRRVIDAEKASRERRGYAVAVGAAVISAFSAIAAWIIHLK